MEFARRLGTQGAKLKNHREGVIGVKKTIVWVSSDGFLDTDAQIVPKLSASFNIKWVILYLKRDGNKAYSQQDIERICLNSNVDLIFIYLKYKQKDVRVIFSYYKIFSMIQGLKGDLIFSDVTQACLFFHLLAKLFLNKNKYICSMHDVVLHKKFKNSFWIQRVNNFMIKTFSNVLVFSQVQKEIAEQRNSKINTYYAGGMCLKDFGRPERCGKKDKMTFLFFGTIRGNKGLVYLLEAGNMLYKKYPDKFTIKIAGHCDNWETYQSVIKHPEAFDFKIGFVDNREIPDLFAESSYLVLPYLDVTQSGPLMIAYNYNVPVIASNLPGFHEYIDDKNTGYLFRTADSFELYRILEECVNLDETGYMSIKNNLSRFIENNLTTEAIAFRYASIFNKIMSS
ncbi:MAG: glycosyltransferase [Desulfobacter postgatei]|uniref:glycosyltransferase n=1 Tax=Desulfobacter postgatei TaxID=2293 RepID=UPI0023F3CE62|nr:glycosyltransferase [Desulfobacter postgatei]MDD4274332.1 glycosyltransferase [Desulfobacter postgatei]